MRFRLWHGVNILLLLPMVVLGVMLALTGGISAVGRQLGEVMFTVAPVVTIGCIIGSEIVWRWQRPRLAHLVAGFPVLMFVILLAWVQLETGFFT